MAEVEIISPSWVTLVQATRDTGLVVLPDGVYHLLRVSTILFLQS